MPDSKTNRYETMADTSDKDKKKRGFMPRKKKVAGNGGKPDDDSVDSKGNIRGLIDYEYDSDEDTSDSSYKPPKRKGKKDTKPKNKLVRRSKSDDETSDSEPSEPSSESAFEQLLQQLLEEKIAEQLGQKKPSTSKKVDGKEKANEKVTTKSTKKVAPKRKPKYEILSTSEESEEEEEESEEESEVESEEEEESEEEDDSDSDGDEQMPGGFIINLGGGDDMDRMVPKRHNMRKESSEVKKFVKLLTTQPDEDTIDGQIDQFKALPEDQRTKLLSVLEARAKTPASMNPQQGLMFKILTMNLPAETQQMVFGKYNALQMLDPGTSEYFKMRNWLEKLTSLPLGIYKELPVKIADGRETCGSFMEKARQALDEAIYGQDEAKLAILQFIGTKIANPSGKGLSLLLAGPPGIGKTSLIKNGVAKALQWPFQFISLGGDSDASTYTGHQLVYESSHCGKIVNSLCAAKSMSLVLMFDEVDKISTTPKGEEVQNLLVHLTDSTQNMEFEDKYLASIPIDLSRVMFTFSANYLERIDRVLLDRMTVINLKGYSLKEKAAIAENYLLPAALKEVDLADKIGFGKDVIQHVIETYAAEETGVRELKRCIEQISQKLNLLRMYNCKDMPFYIKDFNLPFILQKSHVDLLLKKKESGDQSFKAMYI